MIITVTERGSYKRCQRMWSLASKNGEHLTPIVVSPALNIGTLVHNAGEKWILDPSKNFTYFVVEAATEMEQSVRERYKKQVGAEISDAEMAPFNESVELARAMAENYQVRWGTPIPEGFKCVQPEQKIQIPIPGAVDKCATCDGPGDVYSEVFGDANPDICPECRGAGEVQHFLEMRLDGLLQASDGSIWVLERKTYGQRPKLESLQYNDQFLAYMWGLTQLGVAGVGGIAYDGLWKRASAPRGRTFEDLFLRHMLTRSQAELDEFGELLVLEAKEMYATLNRGKFTINRQWMGCWDCNMQKLCVAMSRGESTDAIRRMHYTERTDDIEEQVEAEA